MFDWFGAEMPLAVRFFLAFLIVLGLIGVTAWAVRKFGSGRLGGAGMRGRQPRLAVIDHASVDARRRLILVRRDNVEHLLMIGGPTDMVVESNIVRATPAAREAPVARLAAAAETLPRAIPLPEVASNGSWPLQPEPSAPPAPPVPPGPPRRALRAEPIAEQPASSPPQPHVEAPPRPPREALAALAEDLAAHPVPPVPPVALVTPAPARSRPAATARPPATEPRAEPRAEYRPEPRPEPRAAPRPPAPPANAEAAAAADQTLAEMAQRLEAALRKGKPGEQREASAPSTPAPEHDAASETTTASPAPPPPAPPAPRPARPAEVKSARPEAKTKEGKALYETLEQEMANLLGRPPGKTG